MYRNSLGREIILNSSQPFLLSSIDGVSNINTEIITSNSMGDGVNVDKINIKERILPIEGAIRASTKEELDRYRVYLTSTFNSKLSGEIIYTNNNLTRKIKGTIQSLTFKKNVGLMQEFLIQVLCCNPFWSDLIECKEEIALWSGDLEFPLEIPLDGEGIEIGHRVSNLICNITNNGDVECGIRIQFKALATVKNPSLFNVNTREYIKINKSLNSGDIVEVNTDDFNKKIELIGTDGNRTNIFNWIDLESEFLQLSVGDNLFRYDAEEGIDNLEVSIYYSPKFLGV